MLEVLVHLEVDAEDLPDNLRLIRVTIPEDVEPVSIAGLRKGWEDDEANPRDGRCMVGCKPGPFACSAKRHHAAHN